MKGSLNKKIGKLQKSVSGSHEVQHRKVGNLLMKHLKILSALDGLFYEMKPAQIELF